MLADLLKQILFFSSKPKDLHPIETSKASLSFSGKQDESNIIAEIEKNLSVKELKIESQTVTPRLWNTIFRCSKLEKLTLFDCSWENKSLPKDIKQLTALKTLDLTYSKVQFLPIELSELKLENLDIAYTQVIGLDDTILKIKTLKELILANCPLKNLPACDWDMPNLEVLNLQNLPIEKWPSQISKLSSLKSLNLSHAPIKVLQIDNLKNLEELNIAGSKVISFPSLGKHKLKSINVLGCEDLIPSTLDPLREKKDLIIIR